MTTKTLKVEGATKRAKANPLAGQIAGNDTAAADYAADVTEKAVAGDSLKVLQALAADLVDKTAEVVRIDRQLKIAQAQLAEIQERKLPDLMEEYGLPSFNFFDRTTGRTLIIKFNPKWRASLPPLKDKDGNIYPDAPAKRKAIFAWLREIGLGGVIKKEVAANLGALSDDKVNELLEKLHKENPELELGVSEEIHPSTLTAQVRRLKDDGKNVHEDLVVTRVRKAEFTEK